MLPLRNNLLSPSKKDHLAQLLQIQFLKNMLEMVFIMISIIGIVFLGSQRILQNYFTSLTESMVSVQDGHGEEIQEIQRINKTLHTISNIQKQYFTWTPLLMTLGHATTNGIVLNNVSIDQKTKKITIDGHATDRDDFLQYQEALKKLPQVAEIQSPLSDLTKVENFSFTILVSLK